MTRYIKLGLLTLGLLPLGLASCKKDYFRTKPSNAVTEEVLFETTGNAYIALNGVHTLLVTSKLAGDNHRDFGAKAADLQNDLMGADVVSQDAGGYDWFYYYYNYLAPKDVSNEAYIIWLFHYRVINNVNAIIKGVDGASGPEADKKDIKGQAYAYRAWAYYRLLTRFCAPYFNEGGVIQDSKPGIPIYTEPASGESRGNPRGTIRDVVELIDSDIAQAIALLEGGATTHTEKSHINAKVAHGIAARIAMYKHDYEAALDHAKKAMEGYSFMSPADFGSGLNSRTNPEFMWCSTLSDQQYQELSVRSWISFVDESAPGYAGLTSVERKITKALYDQIEASDYRRVWWSPGGSPRYHQRKFRTAEPTSFKCDVLYMRVAEMYLIAAEAAARLDRLPEARDFLQALVSTRHNVAVSVPATKDELIERILWERRVELWLEGFAQSDLKERNLGLERPGGADNHNPAQAFEMSIPANHNWFTFKIPLAEINANPNIGPEDQNP